MSWDTKETMTRERWGASKFVRNQWRAISDNAYEPDMDPDSLPQDLPEDWSRHAIINFQQFFPIVAPAFRQGRNQMSMPHIKAMFKRAHCIVNTTKYTYIKMAQEDNVKVFHHVDSYLTQGAGELLAETKETNIMPSADLMRDLIGGEQEIVRDLIREADQARRGRPRLALPAPLGEVQDDGSVFL